MDYIGVGPVWWTGSKDVSTKEMVGVDGVGEVLDVVAEWEQREGKEVGVVAIGERGTRLENRST